MKKLFFYSCLIITFLSHRNIQAQPIDSTRFKIAIFTPLFLDSAFNAFDTSYRYAKNEFPKMINPGLEFYEGALIALDSFASRKIPIDVYIFDSKSTTETVTEQLNKPELEDVNLIIAYCSTSDLRTFAEAGLQKNIPVINVNIPNDGGVTSNPFFVLLNPTLKTQCEGIYKYIQKYYSLNNVVVFRKKGQIEDLIKMYFDDYSKNTMSTPLTFNYIDLVDSFTVNTIKKHLDTTSITMCVAGSLDEKFGKRLVAQLTELKKQNYQSVIMGMPTWDGINDFKKPEYKGLEIIYSTPFYNARTDKVSQAIIDYFNTVMYARPSDMVMRGYETVWRFGNLLIKYKKDLASNITYSDFNVFREYDIQPVINRQTLMLDYFENKKLYFLKWLDGMIKAVN